jgi:hypothetical protein
VYFLPVHFRLLINFLLTKTREFNSRVFLFCVVKSAIFDKIKDGSIQPITCILEMEELS